MPLLSVSARVRLPRLARWISPGGAQQVRLVRKGAQLQGFLQGPGQEIEIIGAEALETLLRDDHAERAIVVLQEADPQLRVCRSHASSASDQRGGRISGVWRL